MMYSLRYITIYFIYYYYYFIDFTVGKLNCQSEHSKKQLDDILGIQYVIDASQLLDTNNADKPNPGKIVSDVHMKICVNGITQYIPSCCSSKSEETYASQRVTFQMKEYLLFNSPSVENLTKLSTDFENNFHKILEKSMVITEKLFGSNLLFMDTPERFIGPLKKLRSIIRNFISSGVSQSKISNGFRIFLQQLFPPMIFPEWRLALFKAETVQCIEETSFSTALFNRPFEGESSRPLLTMLSKAIEVERALIQNIQLVSQVLNYTTNHYAASSDCSDALMRLHLCPACMGAPAPVKENICQPFCQTTLADCLRWLAPLGQSLNLLNENIHQLLTFSMGKDGFRHVFLQLPRYISMAIQEARFKLTLYKSQLGSICQVNMTTFNQLPSFEPVLEQNSSIHNEDSMYARYSSANAFNFKDIFPKIVDRNCDRLPLRNCWNGREVAPLGINSSWTWTFEQFGKSRSAMQNAIRRSVQLKLNKFVDVISAQNKRIIELVSAKKALKRLKNKKRKPLKSQEQSKNIDYFDKVTFVDDEDILDASGGSGGSGSGSGYVTSTATQPRLQFSTNGDENLKTTTRTLTTYRTEQAAFTSQKPSDEKKECKDGEKEPCKHEEIKKSKPYKASSNGGCCIYLWNSLTLIHALLYCSVLTYFRYL